NLPAAAFSIVIAVIAFAVGTYGTTVVHVVTQLTHVLDHHVHPVRVALAKMSAARIVRPPSAELDGAIADVVPALALLAEPIVLKLQHGRECKGVVGSGGVDVLRADTGVGPQDVAGISAGDRRDRTRLIVHIDARLAHATRDAADERRGVLEVARMSRTCDYDGRGVVGLHAAVEQMQRLADDAAGQHVLHSN